MKKEKTRKEKNIDIATFGLTVIVMLSGKGTNVDETNCPTAKIKEFSELNQIIQISKPEKLMSFNNQWSKLSKKIKNKSNFKVVLDDILFSDNNISYKEVKSQEVKLSKNKVKNNIVFDDSIIITQENSGNREESKSMSTKKTKYT